jgi:peptidoglycan/xylan/chitin deacetylase (PgdA/CDA1 family)
MKAVSLLFHDVYLTDPRESGFASAAADRYKLPVRDFDAQIARIPAGRPFRLTVDDGGVSYYTLMADRLEALGWRGHCFVSTGMIGRQGFLSPAQIRELDARGHIIGSHSVTHPARFSACSIEQMRDEWSRSRHHLEDILGHEVVVASVPGGYYSTRVAETAAESGLKILFNSEPTTAVSDANGLIIVGRYTIRQGDPVHTSARLVAPAPWARCAAWASWNAKGIVKPILGPSYRRVADWVLAGAERTRPTWS